MQASFAQAGLRLDIQPVVESDLWGKMRGRDFQAIFTYWGADYLDPNTNASAFAYNVPGGPKTLAWRTVGHSRHQRGNACRGRGGQQRRAQRTLRHVAT